uniref:Capsid protein n=1 Tax=Geladintestivirus 6 TaxID=3233138 RepID=A0AAU8MJV6_9CAUD
MKQLLIVSNTTLNGGATTPKNLSSMAKGAIGFYHLDNDAAWLSTAVTKNFAIALGYGAKANAFVIPEVDFSSLTLQKATSKAATTFTAKVTISSVIVDKEYTIMIVKKGVVFHERNTWTATSLAKSTTVADVAADLVKQINASKETSGITATNTGGAITLTATQPGVDYEIVCADELTGVKPTAVTNGIAAILDKAYVEDLASRCAAGKGFNYTADDAHEIYPGYPETVADITYTLYTLRFKVGRSAAKQRDEQVYQIVHIAVPSSATDFIKSIDTILGIGTTPTPSVGDGD